MLRALRPALNALILATLTASAFAAEPLPYNESADARAELKAAIAQAKSQKKHVLVVFGANWCKDCRELARKMAEGTVAQHVAKQYVVTKVDIGNWDRNQDIAADCGNPSKKGIPAVAVLGADGKLRKATSAGELASARDMGEAELMAVFEQLAK
ncbi:thioredoxin family protein [Niveibacterium sp. 24ML]|uniref:thioredoxin family protein n=1 Tax=Niveibacterium sp. 24ML TaxID=2985512 RepID=UPI00226FF330|nr:thioredoxin family protein [Niveibacterium sp. 24ML]MCX9158200.1 thioredoxin family protein [Niveibacterium sp. 24ML]